MATIYFYEIFPLHEETPYNRIEKNKYYINNSKLFF